jgi:hypothetical protein
MLKQTLDAVEAEARIVADASRQVGETAPAQSAMDLVDRVLPRVRSTVERARQFADATLAILKVKTEEIGAGADPATALDELRTLADTAQAISSEFMAEREEIQRSRNAFAAADAEITIKLKETRIRGFRAIKGL